MAATPLSSLVIPELIEPYVSAFLPEVLSLAQSKIVVVEDKAKFVGNAWDVPKYTQFSTNWQPPTANTDATVYGMSANREIGVMSGRIQAVGNETFNIPATGDNAVDEFSKQITHYVAKQIEREFGAGLLPGLFDASGALNSTHTVGSSSTTLDTTLATLADEKMNERVDALEFVIMHSDCFAHQKRAGMASSVDPIAAQSLKMGDWIKGEWAGKNVIINNRIATKNNDGTYYVYFCGRGSLVLGYQMPLEIRYIPDTGALALKGGGTDFIRLRTRFATHCPGVKWNTTVPTNTAGALITDLATVGNWTKTDSSCSNEEIPIIRATVIIA